MSDKPKVSERMAGLVRGYGQNAIAYGGRGSYHDKASLHICREQLLSAIAEIEQRAGEIDFFASIVREHYADIVMPTAEDRDAAKPSDWINCAILELGNQHKRAERAERLLAEHVRKYRTLPDGSDAKQSALEEERDKWKETAVAMHEAALCTHWFTVTVRLERAWRALGPAWDEAVR